MKLSDAERITLLMLAEIQEKLGINNSIDPKFAKEAIYGGHDWAWKWEYPGLFPEITSDAVVKEVTDILDMWWFIEFSSSEKFPGFDGNRESDHSSVARFMTEHMDRFDSFKGRTGNGVLGLDGYRRMYQAFEPMRLGLGGGNKLSSEQVQELMDERVHPSNR